MAEDNCQSDHDYSETATVSGTRTRILRQRPSSQAELPRRDLAEGFSSASAAETIVLSDRATVERSRPLHFSIQRGVLDPVGERYRRFGDTPSGYLAERLFVSRLPGALVHANAVKGGRLLRFRELFAVSRGMMGIPTLVPDAVYALAKLAEPAMRRRRSLAGPIVSCPRLFVSRALVERRHITNEAELLKVLEPHGFEKVHPETLSVSEQIELFASAEVVIGAFGTGLTNLIFSPPNTLVIELQPEEVSRGGNLFLWNLTSIRGQRFAQIVCPVTEGMRYLPLGERDMTVDVHHVDELLGRLLPHTETRC